LHTKTIKFLDYNVELTLDRRLKNSYIRVKDSKTILVKSALNSPSYIIDMLHTKRGWIEKQIAIQRDAKKLMPKLSQELLLFGELLSINTKEALGLKKSIERLKNKNDTVAVEKLYDLFYKEFATEYLTQLTDKSAHKMGLSYNKIRFRKMKSRWGSCNSKGYITLNTELLKIKKELIEYVIVHELAHLVHMNHSKRFHTLVEQYLPDAKKRRVELKSIYLTNI
jgi:predicted metal-dependent hydrolase